MSIPPITPNYGNSFHRDTDPAPDVPAEKIVQDPSALASRKGDEQGLEVDNFSEKFDRDQNGQLNEQEIERLGQFISNISKKVDGEVHVGVSQADDGTLQARVTAGEKTEVPAAYPPGDPVFSGHTHLSGNSTASDADIASRLDDGTNVVWDAQNGETGYY